jgi:hypothetical protein
MADKIDALMLGHGLTVTTKHARFTVRKLQSGSYQYFADEQPLDDPCARYTRGFKYTDDVQRFIVWTAPLDQWQVI